MIDAGDPFDATGGRRRPTGPGHYRRKDGRYEAAVWVTTPTGQRRRKRVNGRTHDDRATT